MAMKMIICEKKDAAKRISKILSGEVYKTEKYARVDYYTFDDNIVIGLKGHIMSLDYPEEFRKWSYRKLENMLEAEPVKTISDHNIGKLIDKLISEVGEIIIATDFDREGELIGVETLNYIYSSGWKGKISRIRFSSLSPGEIKTAFASPVDIDYGLSDAGETRQHIDLMWGAILTRYTSIISGRGGSEFLSVGRVQTPTLALIVMREKEIKSFVPKKYYDIHADVALGKDKFEINLKKNPIEEKEEAVNIHDSIKNIKKGKVVDVREKTVVEKRPIPFDTTSFIQEATKLGLTATRVMSIAEDLYTSGLISYPRTDNTVYPKTINFREIIEKFNNGKYAEYANDILSSEKLVPSRGKVETTDHPPIYPVDNSDVSSLDAVHRKIYDLIVRRFLSTFMDDAERISRTADIDIGSEIFEAYGIVTTKKGWKDAYPFIGRPDIIIPEIHADDIVFVEEIIMEEKETKPPGRYSQGRLIKEMSKLELGTKATRHEIIQKLYSRGFISGKNPVPTIIGEAIIDVLRKYAQEVTSNKMTSKLEEDMNKIADGKIKKRDVIEESRTMLEKILKELKEKDSNVKKDITEAINIQNTVGICSCGGNLRIIKTRNGRRFVGCSNYPKCKVTYSLPPHGKIVPLGTVCKDCGAPMVKLVSGRMRYNICINLKCDSNKLPVKKKSDKKEDVNKEYENKDENKIEEKVKL